MHEHFKLKGILIGCQFLMKRIESDPNDIVPLYRDLLPL